MNVLQNDSSLLGARFALCMFATTLCISVGFRTHGSHWIVPPEFLLIAAHFPGFLPSSDYALPLAASM